MGYGLRLLVGGAAVLGSCLACSVDDVVGTRTTPGTSSDVSEAGSDAATDDPNCPDALFCSSFAQGLAGLDTVENGGTLGVAASGFDDQAALRSTLDQGGGAANIRVNLTTSSVSAIYLRAYLWVGSDQQLDDISIFFLGPSVAGAGLAFGLRSSERIELFWAERQLSLMSEPGAFLRERWQCIQLRLVVDAANGEVTVQVDGESVVSQTGIDSNLGGDLTYFNFGIEWSADSQVPVEVLLDDVILSQNPVECL
jgi:hypothetical protein